MEDTHIKMEDRQRGILVEQENPIACASIGQDQPICEEKHEWRPTRMECLKNYQINIEFLSMGCIVRVGCMSIPFQFINDAMDAIKAYTEHPYEERQKWEKLIESRQ